jgi:hypothetical protein
MPHLAALVLQLPLPLTASRLPILAVLHLLRVGTAGSQAKEAVVDSHTPCPLGGSSTILWMNGG